VEKKLGKRGGRGDKKKTCFGGIKGVANYFSKGLRDRRANSPNKLTTGSGGKKKRENGKGEHGVLGEEGSSGGERQPGVNPSEKKSGPTKNVVKLLAAFRTLPHRGSKNQNGSTKRAFRFKETIASRGEKILSKDTTGQQ